MTTVRRGIVCMAAGFITLSLTGGMADAQTVKRGTARRISSVQGVDTYKAYCATCHGSQAKGDGPAAAALKKLPADLTTIAKRNGGKFSATDVEAVIIGQQGCGPMAREICQSGDRSSDRSHPTTAS